MAARRERKGRNRGRFAFEALRRDTLSLFTDAEVLAIGCRNQSPRRTRGNWRAPAC